MKDLIAGLLALAFVATCAYGWIINIVHLAGADVLGGVEVLRVIGIFMAPLGIIMGLFV